MGESDGSDDASHPVLDALESEGKKITERAVEAAREATSNIDNQCAVLKRHANVRLKEIQAECVSMDNESQQAYSKVIEVKQAHIQIHENVALFRALLNELDQAQERSSKIHKNRTSSLSDQKSIEKRKKQIEAIQGAVQKLQSELVSVVKEVEDTLSKVESCGIDTFDNEDGGGDRNEEVKSYLLDYMAEQFRRNHCVGMSPISEKRKKSPASRQLMPLGGAQRISLDTDKYLQTARLLAYFKIALGTNMNRFTNYWRKAAKSSETYAVNFPQFKLCAEKFLRDDKTFNQRQLKALFRGLDIYNSNSIDMAAIYWSFASDWLVQFHPDAVVHRKAISNPRLEALNMKHPLQRSQEIFRMYSSAQCMTQMQWAAFVHDCRICSNRFSFKSALRIFESVKLKSTANSTGLVTVSEQEWFSLCHLVMATRMGHHHSPLGPGAVEARAWQQNVINTWDTEVILPLCHVLCETSTRPAWQDLWLFDLRSLQLSLPFADYLWYVFMVIASQQHSSTLCSADVMEMETDISRQSVVKIFMTLGIIPRLLDLQSFNRLADTFHHHSIPPPTKNLHYKFPEFFELCLAISAHCSDIGNGLPSGFDRLMLYFRGKVSITKDADDLVQEIQQRAVESQRERVTRAFTG